MITIKNYNKNKILGVLINHQNLRQAIKTMLQSLAEETNDYEEMLQSACYITGRMNPSGVVSHSAEDKLYNTIKRRTEEFERMQIRMNNEMASLCIELMDISRILELYRLLAIQYPIHYNITSDIFAREKHDVIAGKYSIGKPTIQIAKDDVVTALSIMIELTPEELKNYTNFFEEDLKNRMEKIEGRY